MSVRYDGDMKISPKRWRSLDFHIENDDYFGTLATVLDLLRQDVESDGWRQLHTTTLVQMRDELVYLQRYFRIRKITVRERS